MSLSIGLQSQYSEKDGRIALYVDRGQEKAWKEVFGQKKRPEISKVVER